MFKGKEIRKLMLIGALCCALMIAAISSYLVISSRRHLKSQADKMSESLAQSIGEKLDISFENITDFLKETPAIPMSTDAWKTLFDDPRRVIGFFTGCAWAMFDCDYAVQVDTNGEIYIGYVKQGKDLKDFPLELMESMGATRAEARYEIVDSIAGDQGAFIVFARAINVPTLGRDMTFAFVIDATDQVDALGEAYGSDRGDMVAKQAAVSAGIFLLLLALSVLVIYFSIKRNLSNPIDAINASARGIASGQKSKDIEPDEKSLFYNLQMLLRSGQVIFEKSRQIDEKGGE